MRKSLHIWTGAALMIAGMYGSTLKIETTWHYFGTGVFFGVGIALIIIPLLIKSKGSM